MSNNIVDIRQLSISRGDHLILDQINLQIEAAEFIYLIGKTGCGKTSLLKTMYGILPVQQGKGQIAGFELSNLDRKSIPFMRRKVGFIFQDFVLLTDRTVKENLFFAMEATGWKDQHQMQLKMEAVLILVGLQGVERKMPHQLSGGEQQRVVIARALLNDPDLIIADEATGNLDPETAGEILILLKHLSNNHNTAVLFATHNYELIKRYPARVIQCVNRQLLELESV